MSETPKPYNSDAKYTYTMVITVPYVSIENVPRSLECNHLHKRGYKSKTEMVL